MLPQDVTAGKIAAANFYSLKIELDVLTCAASGTMQKLFANSKFAWKVTIQNLTTTAGTVVTVVAESGTGAGFNGVASNGEILNAGPAKNAGGGSAVYGASSDPRALVDASTIYWTATNTSDQISVRLEIPENRLF